MHRNSENYTNLIVLAVILLITLSLQTTNAKISDCTPIFQPNSDDSFIIKSHTTNINIFSQSNISVTEIFEIENKHNVSVSSIDFWLNQSCSDINVRDGLGNLVFTTPIKTDFYNLLSIQLRTALLSNRSTFIYVYYNLERSIFSHKNPDHLRFEFFSTISYHTDNHDLTIKLPKKSFVLESDEIVDIIYPTGYYQYFVGQRIAISWSKSNLVACDNPYYRVRFEQPSGNPLILWLSILGPILGIGLGISCTLWIMKRRERKAVKEIGEIFLNESQKILLKTIYESGGKIIQRELSRKTGFTRSKTSRNLIALEQQGMVQRERWGRNTIIRITKTGEKVIE